MVRLIKRLVQNNISILTLTNIGVENTHAFIHDYSLVT